MEGLTSFASGSNHQVALRTLSARDLGRGLGRTFGCLEIGLSEQAGDGRVAQHAAALTAIIVHEGTLGEGRGKQSNDSHSPLTVCGFGETFNASRARSFDGLPGIYPHPDGNCQHRTTAKASRFIPRVPARSSSRHQLGQNITPQP